MSMASEFALLAIVSATSDWTSIVSPSKSGVSSPLLSRMTAPSAEIALAMLCISTDKIPYLLNKRLSTVLMAIASKSVFQRPNPLLYVWEYFIACASASSLDIYKYFSKPLMSLK